MHKPSLLSLALLGSALAMPLAFAQDDMAATSGQTGSPVGATSTEASATTDAAATTDVATPVADASVTADADAATGVATDGATATPATRQVTWADLDADNDGSLSRSEAAPLASLVQVFDDADADSDGKLTPEEYRAFVAANGTTTEGTAEGTADDSDG
jgi:hypothetical protein